MRTRPALLLAALAAGLLTAGCLDLAVAKVPERLLEGAGGNGWQKNVTSSQRAPTSTQGGFLKTQTLVYEDRQHAPFYGTLTVQSVRALTRPNEENVRDEAQDAIRQRAQAQGIRIQGGPATGARHVLSGGSSFWFAYNGTVEQTGFFSTQSAQVKIFGEVFPCSSQKTDVIVVGLAQASDVRAIGGVTLPSDPDYSTWAEIVADPRGSVEGYRGSEGLAYNVACQ